VTSDPLVLPYGDDTPELDPEAWVAPGAVVVGAVTLAAGSSVWYGAVLRADVATITVGAGSNVQDNAVLHADPGHPLTIGADVTIGHGAVVHGCTVGDGALIGMGSTVLNGAVVGAGSIVAAGALVPQGAEVPPGSLAAGVPAKVRREVTEQERQGALLGSAVYRDLAAKHRQVIERSA
jgi:carbonic anhydrase/acetyltransferase-like protein (isoleucine patch superfamily)